MNSAKKSPRLEIEALVIGYAMSRLDEDYLAYRGIRSWRGAFDEAARALIIPPSSLKNLRDEFDPVHGNRRKGWHKRPLRPNRQRILEDLKDVGNDALMALVDRIIARDDDATSEAIDSMALLPRPAQNVAERLLTGRRAEEYFLAHSEPLIGVRQSDLIDRRIAACGYDFAVIDQSDLAIEVKGLKTANGDLLFTDREWTESRIRLDNYLLVVIGNLDTLPAGRVIRNPSRSLKATCSYQQTITAVWRSRVSVAC
jgi:hypothetical protein